MQQIFQEFQPGDDDFSDSTHDDQTNNAQIALRTRPTKQGKDQSDQHIPLSERTQQLSQFLNSDVHLPSISKPKDTKGQGIYQRKTSVPFAFSDIAAE